MKRARVERKTNQHFGRILVVLISIILAGCASKMPGEAEIESGSYDKAVQILQEYVASNPNNAQGRSRYGLALLKTNQTEESILQLKKALDLEPGAPHAILYLGMAYMNKGEFDNAAKTWRKYRNQERPLVEEEIKRLLTTVIMTQAQKEAEEALSSESKRGISAPETNTIAVGYLKDMSPDQSLRAFQKGLTSMLITDISKVKSFKVVEREKLQALLEEMKLGQTGIVNEKTAPRVGKLLRVENMVVGNLSRGSIEAVIGVASTGAAGGKKGSAVGRVEEKKFFELPPILIEKIFQILQVELTREQRKAIGIPHTKNYKAFMYYGRCLDALDMGDWLKAKDQCRMAVTEDPQFVLAREAYESVPGKLAPTIQSIKGLDSRGIVAAVESSLNEVFEKEAEDKAEKALEAMEGGGSDGGGGGGGH